jgi:hypothetical protein
MDFLSPDAGRARRAAPKAYQSVIHTGYGGAMKGHSGRDFAVVMAQTITVPA